jgi:predicted GNAT superfamily acetyltransferase
MSTNVTLREVAAEDFPDILRLNASVSELTSEMALPRLQAMCAQPGFHRCIFVDGRFAGFILAMRENADYKNVNFAYFASRYPNFLYVDRIVVEPAFKGLQLGSRIYAEAFAYARQQALPVISCEYNIQPPNEASRRFHDKFGFHEIGQQELDGGKKTVSMQVAKIEF